MADLRIPPHFRPALLLLAEKDSAAIEELCKLLEAKTEALTSRQAALELASTLKSLSQDEGFTILEAVIPLMFYKASSAKPTREVLKDVVTSLTLGSKEDSKLPTSAIAKFEINLGRILELSGVALKAKALSVGTDSQRIFSDAKILSDMRPVFGDSVSDPPLGVVVLHSLRIDYSENGEEKEFFVSLDLKDLESLQAHLARALEKDASLKRFSERSKLQLFDT